MAWDIFRYLITGTQVNSVAETIGLIALGEEPSPGVPENRDAKSPPTARLFATVSRNV